MPSPIREDSLTAEESRIIHVAATCCHLKNSPGKSVYHSSPGNLEDRYGGQTIKFGGSVAGKTGLQDIAAQIFVLTNILELIADIGRIDQQLLFL